MPNQNNSKINEQVVAYSTLTLAVATIMLSIYTAILAFNTNREEELKVKVAIATDCGTDTRASANDGDAWVRIIQKNGRILQRHEMKSSRNFIFNNILRDKNASYFRCQISNFGQLLLSDVREESLFTQISCLSGCKNATMLTWRPLSNPICLVTSRFFFPPQARQTVWIANETDKTIEIKYPLKVQYVDFLATDPTTKKLHPPPDIKSWTIPPALDKAPNLLSSSKNQASSVLNPKAYEPFDCS